MGVGEGVGKRRGRGGKGCWERVGKREGSIGKGKGEEVGRGWKGTGGKREGLDPFVPPVKIH